MRYLEILYAFCTFLGSFLCRHCCAFSSDPLRHRMDTFLKNQASADGGDKVSGKGERSLATVDGMGTEAAKETMKFGELNRRASKRDLSDDLSKACEKLADRSEAALVKRWDEAVDSFSTSLLQFRREVNTAAMAVEENVQGVKADMAHTTNAISDQTRRVITRKELTMPETELMNSKETVQRPYEGGISAAAGSQMAEATSNATRTFALITKTAQATMDNSTAKRALLSAEFEESASETQIGGAAIAATSISLLQGGNIAISGAAGLGAALLAVTKGPQGDLVRQVGDLAWNAGQRVVRLSEDPEFTDRLITMNSKVLTRAIDLLERNEKENQQKSIDDQIVDLHELILAIRAFYDEFYKELDRVETEALQTSGGCKEDIRLLEKDLKQLMQEMQCP